MNQYGKITDVDAKKAILNIFETIQEKNIFEDPKQKEIFEAWCLAGIKHN